MSIEKVVIVGGTHGNERTGICLLKKWQAGKQTVVRSSFATDIFFANPKAASLYQRFIDRDLNRCFLDTDINNDSLYGYEDLRAKAIKRMFEQKSVSENELTIDMHTTTTNMGSTLICNSDRGNIEIASAVKQRIPEARLYIFENSERILSCLRSITKYGIGIEIGPVPQNVLRHDILIKMEQVVLAILDIAHELNTAGKLSINPDTEAYYHIDDIYYPERTDGLQTVVHRHMEGKDYKELRTGDPIFINPDGSIIKYEGRDHVFPVFINEAGYYVKNLAFSLTRKTSVGRVIDFASE